MDKSYNPVDDYNNGTGQSAWLEKQQRRSKRSKLFIALAAAVIVAVIVIAVAVGVTVSNHNKNNKNASSNNGGSGSGSSNGNTPVNQTDPNDPSSFVKDPRLHKSFYGFAYTPADTLYPTCGAKLSDVITDIQLLSQLTNKIRLYGADCNVSSLVLEAIKQTKVDMTVFLANFVVDGDPTAYDRQKQELQQALQTYGTGNVGGITVGNEFILDYLTDNGGGDDPNGAVGNQGAALLLANITDTRQMLQEMGLNLQVGTSDAGAYFNNEVLNAVDYGMANVHPWFASVSIEDAAGWTWDFFETTDVTQAQATTKQPTMYIAETGWPTNSNDTADATDGVSAASEANLQIFLDTYVCQANTNGTKYFYFEYFDEPWQELQYGGVEGYWGIFNSNRTLKNIQIPNCPISD